MENMLENNANGWSKIIILIRFILEGIENQIVQLKQRMGSVQSVFDSGKIIWFNHVCWNTLSYQGLVDKKYLLLSVFHHFRFHYVAVTNTRTIQDKSVGTLDIFQTNFPLTP